MHREKNTGFNSGTREFEWYLNRWISKQKCRWNGCALFCVNNARAQRVASIFSDELTDAIRCLTYECHKYAGRKKRTEAWVEANEWIWILPTAIVHIPVYAGPHFAILLKPFQCNTYTIIHSSHFHLYLVWFCERQPGKKPELKSSSKR